MQKDTHYTAVELDALRKNAVLACADYELALHFNKYLTDHGVEPASVESWSAVLSRRLGKPFQRFQLFSLGAE